MERNLKGELLLMKNMSIKPNFAALGREYGMDPRTVKKYYNGYEGYTGTLTLADTSGNPVLLRFNKGMLTSYENY